MRTREAGFLVVKHARFTVTAAVACTVVYTRSPHVVWCTVGGLSCSVLARVLKHIIKQPRPTTVVEVQTTQKPVSEIEQALLRTTTETAVAAGEDVVIVKQIGADGGRTDSDASDSDAGDEGSKEAAGSTTVKKLDPTRKHKFSKRLLVKRVFSSSTHGMPSSHTQVTSFFAAYATFAVLAPIIWPHEAHDVGSALAPTSGPSLFAIAFVLFINSFCWTTAWSRIHLNRHTPAQVAVGWLVGTSYAGLWYWAWIGDIEEKMVGIFQSIGLL